MGIEATCAALVRVLLASGVAAPLAWAASSGLRGRCGPRAAYLAWACVPAAVAGALLPPAGIGGPAAVSLARIDLGTWEPDGTGAATGWPSFLLLAWLGGALACAGLLAWRQYRFQRALGPLHALGGRLFRAAAATVGLPAAIGLLRPRIVVPADFAVRYSPAERHLVLAHERAHLQRGDLWAHALAALLLCLHWFNPLMHAAMRRFRRDQELACDALVIARLRCTPHAYGAALLKAASIVPEYLPVACHWTCPHPLKERLAMLKHRPPSPRRLRAARLFAAAWPPPSVAPPGPSSRPPRATLPRRQRRPPLMSRTRRSSRRAIRSRRWNRASAARWWYWSTSMHGDGRRPGRWRPAGRRACSTPRCWTPRVAGSSSRRDGTASRWPDGCGCR
jgi:beta-lactamase regulating signal transducer with metallopeptidase domain